jgi:hypothetical protein
MSIHVLQLAPGWRVMRALGTGFVCPITLAVRLAVLADGERWRAEDGNVYQIRYGDLVNRPRTVRSYFWRKPPTGIKRKGEPPPHWRRRTR